MKLFIIILYAFLPWPLFATSVLPRSLTNLVADADHVFIGKVTLVDMVDKQGNQVTNLSARTGPGSFNKIRLHVSVETNGVLFSTAKQVPASLTVALWSMWHYSLGQIKDIEENQRSIFLLKGSNFDIVYPNGFSRALSEQAEIEQLLKQKGTQNKTITPFHSSGGIRASP